MSGVYRHCPAAIRSPAAVGSPPGESPRTDQQLPANLRPTHTAHVALYQSRCANHAVPITLCHPSCASRRARPGHRASRASRPTVQNATVERPALISSARFGGAPDSSYGLSIRGARWLFLAKSSGRGPIRGRVTAPCRTGPGTWSDPPSDDVPGSGIAGLLTSAIPQISVWSSAVDAAVLVSLRRFRAAAHVP
jgi:hypothetical protein